MRFLIQRVTDADVTVEGKSCGAIGRGFLVFIGIEDSDTTETADKLIKKMTGLRIFEDENGKTNRSLSDVDGSLLLVSQFTLYADSLLSAPENRKMHRRCTNILYQPAKNW